MTAATVSDFQKKFRYHHGHLREALLQAAEDILKNQGVEHLSLRTLARATGVTQAAPYSHFQDKDELLAAVAERGFQQLALTMAEAATGCANARARIEKLIVSYIRFASSNKALFHLMFGPSLSDMKRFPTLAMTAGKSYALISAALAGRTDQTVETRFLSVTIWSLCHGLTTLIADEKLKPEQFDAATLEEFVSKTVSTFAQHLV